MSGKVNGKKKGIARIDTKRHGITGFKTKQVEICVPFGFIRVTKFF
jgi:hypothetical protein